MAVTSGSEFGVFGAAARIVLHGDPRPMIDGVGEPVCSGSASSELTRRAVRASIWLWASLIFRLRRRMRGTSEATRALAASTVPAATRTGGLRKASMTAAASRPRMRWRLSSLAIVAYHCCRSLIISLRSIGRGAAIRRGARGSCLEKAPQNEGVVCRRPQISSMDCHKLLYQLLPGWRQSGGKR